MPKIFHIKTSLDHGVIRQFLMAMEKIHESHDEQSTGMLEICHSLHQVLYRGADTE
jgi:hypothetical protein